MKLAPLLVILLLCSVSYSDVMYEMTTTTEGMLGMGSKAMMRVFVKGDQSRIEIASGSDSNDVENMVIITRLDKGVVWTLDDEQEEYTVTNISELKDTILVDASDLPDVNVKATGNTKEILKNECEEYIITMNIDSSMNNGIYFDRVTSDKIAADFYIDDKAIVIKNGNWDAVMKTIKRDLIIRFQYANGGLM